jgi:hypothetical protein
LLHARAKDTHHHLLEYAQEIPVMLTQYVFRSIPKTLALPLLSLAELWRQSLLTVEPLASYF